MNDDRQENNSHFILKVPVSGSKVDGWVVDDASVETMRSSEPSFRLVLVLGRVQGKEFVCRALIGGLTDEVGLSSFWIVSP